MPERGLATAFQETRNETAGVMRHRSDDRAKAKHF